MLSDALRNRILFILFSFLFAMAGTYCDHVWWSGNSPQPISEGSRYDHRNGDPSVDSFFEEIGIEPTDDEDDVSLERNSEKIRADLDEKDDEGKELRRKLEEMREVINMLVSYEDFVLVEEMSKEVTYGDFSIRDDQCIFSQDEEVNAKTELRTCTIIDKPRTEGKCRGAETPFFHDSSASDHWRYDPPKFNGGILALGVDNFMEAATQFCEKEAASGEIPIISIGSGDGTIEEEIIVRFREHFGKEIRILLVDPDPKFDGIVDFKTVDHLIAENPSIVGNCVALIIWPNPVGNVLEEDGKDKYDIEAVQKLQPLAVLAVYESTGGSGSNDFRTFLHDDSLDDIAPEDIGIHNWLSEIYFRKKASYGLDNYSVVELARCKVFIPDLGTVVPRMVKMMRTNSHRVGVRKSN